MNKKNLLRLAFLLFLIIGTILIIRQQHEMPYQHNSGLVFGTVYNITYHLRTFRAGDNLNRLW